MEIQKILDEGGEMFLNNISINIVILGFREESLKVLLYEYQDRWRIPGGYIGKKESVSDATVRILKQRTGLEKTFLKLFQVFGAKDRKFDKEFKQLVKAAGYQWHKDQWINERFISLAYYALIDIEEAEPKGDFLTQKFAWFDINQLPDMILDHEEIIVELHRQLKRDISVDNISYNLLPKEFTMPDLHQLHEVILDKKIERSRFQKKMLSLGIFERLEKSKKDTPGRKPYLYRYKEILD